MSWSENQQRWLALGLLLAVLTLLSAGVVTPLLVKILAYKEEIDDLVFEIQRYARNIESNRDIVEELRQTREEIAEQGYFAKQESVALASAELQTQIKDMVSRANGQLTSSQALPQRDEEQLTRISVRVNLTGTMEMLRQVLYELEYAKPLLVIDQLEVRPMPARRNRKTRQIEPSGKVSVNLEVSAFMRKAT